MEIRLRRFDDWVHVYVHGRLNFTYELMTERLKTLINMGYKRICIDLNQATYLNLASMTHIIRTARSLKKANGQIAILSKDQTLASDLKTLGQKYIRFVQSREDLV